MSVSEILNLPNAEQQKEMVQALQAISNGVSDIAGKKRPFTEIREWRTVQALVRLGLASQFFKERISDQSGEVIQEGTLFQSNYNGTPITWEVIGIDREIITDSKGNEITTHDSQGNTTRAHSLTLMSRYVLPFSLPYNRKDQRAWAPSDIRAFLNGTELSGIPNHQYFTYSSSRNFTITDKPDSLVRVEVDGIILDSSAYSYSDGILTLLSAPSSGAIVTAFYGSANYNNNKSAFLAEGMLDSDLREVLAYRRSLTASRISIDKVFLPSYAEVGGTGVESLLWDEKYGLSYPAFFSSEGTMSALNNRIKTIQEGTPSVWWLRTEYSSDVGQVKAIGSLGKAYGPGFNTFAPCCVIA